MYQKCNFFQFTNNLDYKSSNLNDKWPHRAVYLCLKFWLRLELIEHTIFTERVKKEKKRVPWGVHSKDKFLEFIIRKRRRPVIHFEWIKNSSVLFSCLFFSVLKRAFFFCVTCVCIWVSKTERMWGVAGVSFIYKKKYI